MLKKKGYLIRGGRVIDPSRGLDRVTDVLIEGEKIVGVGDNIARICGIPLPPTGHAGLIEVDDRFLMTSAGARLFEVADGFFEVIWANGLIVAPGFVDLHVHFREPGTEGETIESGGAAAIFGGFTTVCVMPNTNPAIDNGERVAWQHDQAARVFASQSGAMPNLHVVGAMTVGREGRERADMANMARHGAVAFSDDGSGVQDAGVMLDAMRTAADLGVPISDHAEDACLAGAGVINSGEVSREWGIDGKPAVAEEAMIARDIEIARATGAHLHVAHLSTARGVELVRRAKNDGLRVTAEVTPHHIALDERDLIFRENICDPSGRLERKTSDLNPNKKMNPPLRTSQDRAALIQGLREGVIDAIATDHAPHPAKKKDQGIVAAPNGVIGLETAFSVALEHLFVEHGGPLGISELIATLSTNPARIFGLNAGSLRPGSKADLVLIDMNGEWVVNDRTISSASKNSPWFGRTLYGVVKKTFVRGRLACSQP